MSILDTFRNVPKEYYVIVRIKSDSPDNLCNICKGIYSSYDVALKHCQVDEKINGPFQVTYFPDPVLGQSTKVDQVLHQNAIVDQNSKISLAIFSFENTGFLTEKGDGLPKM